MQGVYIVHKTTSHSPTLDAGLFFLIFPLFLENLCLNSLEKIHKLRTSQIILR